MNKDDPRAQTISYPSRGVAVLDYESFAKNRRHQDVHRGYAESSLGVTFLCHDDESQKKWDKEAAVRKIELEELQKKLSVAHPLARRLHEALCRGQRWKLYEDMPPETMARLFNTRADVDVVTYHPERAAINISGKDYEFYSSVRIDDLFSAKHGSEPTPRWVEEFGVTRADGGRPYLLRYKSVKDAPPVVAPPDAYANLSIVVMCGGIFLGGGWPREPAAAAEKKG